MISEFLPALKLFLGMSVLFGAFYPALITGIAQTGFSKQANGSMILKDQKLIGSSLIAQDFKEARFFHARPSGVGFNPMPSGGSNAAPTSSDLLKSIEDRKKAGDTDDLLFASASGLDPEISPAAALSQITRVAQNTGLSGETLTQLVQFRTEGRTLGFLGNPRVNVLLLNLDLLEATQAKR